MNKKIVGITVGTTINPKRIDGTKYVTPQMFGAKGDGVTDDTEAFRTALATSNNVYVPNGSYLITDTLDISYKKSLYADDGQRATILYTGSNSVVSIGRLSVFRNINITFPKAFSGIVFDTNNYNKNSGECALGSRVEHITVDFKVKSPDATLIGITIDSGTDANNIPRLVGVCFQTYHDIHVDFPSCAYGCGIKMELVQGRAFTEATKDGFPWITHVDFDDIFLGRPYTAIKTVVTNTSGAEHFERVNMGHIMFNNVATQYTDNESTRYFLDLTHITGYITKCIPWDYHYYAWNGEKINKIGEGVTVAVSDCSMAAGTDFLHTCDFTAETEYDPVKNPEYFMNKYFKGTVLGEGYDSIDAKIDTKLTSEFVSNIAEEKINDILYSGYSNVLADPLTKIMVGRRWSHSGNAWTDGTYNGKTQTTTVLIPIVTGGNIIRWSPNTCYLSVYHGQLYLFANDELTNPALAGNYEELGFTRDGGYLEVANPSGYKYLAIPFEYAQNISAETVTMTINREITSTGKSYTEYLKENVIDPAVEKKVEEEVESLNNAETWTFTLADGSTVTKKVVIA